MKHYLKDRKFKKGFGISHLVSNIYGGDMMEIKFIPTKHTDWKIRQWGSKYSLLNEANIKNDGKTFMLNNCAKKIELKKHKLSLAINGDIEFKTPRTHGEEWPHLLLEQFFHNFNLSKINNLHAKINFDFVNFINHMDKPDFNIHTFQVGWYFAIGNRNKNNKDYQDFYWFGLPFIDYPRLDYGKPYEAVDAGKEDATNKYIINIAARNYINKPTEPGDNYQIDIDILPWIKKAFIRAQNKGYLKNSKFEDMEIISTNFGIENTGTFSGELKINEIDLYSI